MTSRLYYTDAALTEFEATVVRCDATDGGGRIVLDRTAFYPSSGGQPFDTGHLGDAAVVDVIDEDDSVVVHVTAMVLPVGARVRGRIDWPRRFDHMQQHSGQHLLSAAFDRLLGVRTVSFHLGTETSTIDLAREVTPAEIARAEAEANRVVWDDRSVTVKFVSEEEARALPLRKDPVRTGPLRLVEIADFDLSACGGTHVARTGVVGVIAVAGTERFKGATRVTFVCGGRALHAYRALRDAVAGATRVLSVTPPDLAASIERLQLESRDQVRTIRRLQDDIGRRLAGEFRELAETIGPYRVVLRAESGWDAAGLKGLAAQVVAEPGVVAVFVGDGQPAPVVVARSANVSLDANVLVRETTTALGGRGGGRSELAQAGVPAASAHVVEFIRGRLSQGRL